MAFDLAIRGNVVLPSRVEHGGWLVIQDGKVADVRPSGERPAAEKEWDFADCWVCPGAVDAHVHSSSSAIDPEGFGPLTRAAASGGVTTVLDMPYDGHGAAISRDRIEQKVQAIREEAVVDVGLYGTLPKHDGWKAIRELVEAGVCGFKLSTYESDPERFVKIPDDEIMKTFTELAKYNVPIAFHAENPEIIDPLIAEMYGRGSKEPRLHCLSRPPVAETTAVAKLLELARVYPVSLHIVHLTVPEGYDLIRFYRESGVDVTAETCIHYLVLTEEALDQWRGFARCNPPLRSLHMREQLWRRLTEGLVAYVTSDHVAWPASLKNKDNIFDNKAGFPGVELLAQLFFSEGVGHRDLDICTFCRLVSTNPAKRFGLFPRKGALVVGADADVMIIDPSQHWVYDASRSFSSAKWSPYHGMEILGKVVMTIVRGQVVYHRGEITATEVTGSFIRRLS